MLYRAGPVAIPPRAESERTPVRKNQAWRKRRRDKQDGVFRQPLR